MYYSDDRDDFIQGEITGREKISETNYDLQNDNEILIYKNNEQDINMDETVDFVESMINTPSLTLNKSGFKKLHKKRKQMTSKLLQQSIKNREQSDVT